MQDNIRNHKTGLIQNNYYIYSDTSVCNIFRVKHCLTLNTPGGKNDFLRRGANNALQSKSRDYQFKSRDFLKFFSTCQFLRKTLFHSA